MLTSGNAGELEHERGSICLRTRRLDHALPLSEQPAHPYAICAIGRAIAETLTYLHLRRMCRVAGEATRQDRATAFRCNHRSIGAGVYFWHKSIISKLSASPRAMEVS